MVWVVWCNWGISWFVPQCQMIICSDFQYISCEPSLHHHGGEREVMHSTIRRCTSGVICSKSPLHQSKLGCFFLFFSHFWLLFSFWIFYLLFLQVWLWMLTTHTVYNKPEQLNSTVSLFLVCSTQLSITWWFRMVSLKHIINYHS